MPNGDAVLTSDQRVAALLDAQGYKATEIARTGGWTPQQVGTWRKDPDFRKEVERLREMGMNELKDTIQRVTKGLLKATEYALESLMEALRAEKDDGTPDWYVRQRAAETIMHAAGGVISPKGQRSEGGGDSSAVPFASITVNLDGSHVKPVEVESSTEDEPDDADVVDVPRFITAG